MNKLYRNYIKRFLDIIFSLLGTFALMFIYLPVSILIYLEDKGPIFYNANRLGKNGKVFKMYKFRTMKVNAPDIRNKDGSTYNGEDDPRLTKVGKFLRKTSIDELPQILNVLKGDMSFIGPRPFLNDDFDKSMLKKIRKRNQIRPGITGYSQAYYRNSINQDKKIEKDIYYIENLSFLFDIKILFKTLTSVLSKKGIYNEQQKKILILGASILQVPAIKRAKEMGHYVIVADYNPKAIGIEFADKYYNVSTIDEEKILSIAREEKINGILTIASDMPMRSVAYTSDKLNLYSIDYETALKCTDKFQMIKCFKENNVPSPWYFNVNDMNELKDIKEKLTYPCIIKPTDNSGSRGVVLINNEKELLQGYNYSKESARNGCVLIEEYLEGPEVSVEIIVNKGKVKVLAITDKITTGAPYFVEMGHSQPSGLDKKDKREIKKVAVAAVKAVEIKNGCAHVEMKVTTTGPKMIELGARMGGDCITTHLVPLSTGISMLDLVIKLSLGEKIKIGKIKNNGSAIKFLYSHKGTIKSISGINEAKKCNNIEEVEILCKIGDKIEDINSSTERIGYVIASGKDKQDALLSCDKALKKIKVKIN